MYMYMPAWPSFITDWPDWYLTIAARGSAASNCASCCASKTGDSRAAASAPILRAAIRAATKRTRSNMMLISISANSGFLPIAVCSSEALSE